MCIDILEENLFEMINQNTPDKLAEIIRDTWPNLYRPPADFKPPSEYRPPLDRRLKI
jgi:hypothetical protein